MTPAEQLRDDIRKTAFLKGFQKQNDIAEALEVSAAYVSAIFLGDKNSTPALVDKFVKLLEVSPSKARRWHRLGALEAGWKIESGETKCQKRAFTSG